MSYAKFISIIGIIADAGPAKKQIESLSSFALSIIKINITGVFEVDRQEIENKICEILNDYSQYKDIRITMGDDLRDSYGIDSVALVEVLVAVEGIFDITVDSNLLTYDSFSTAGRIADYVEDKLQTVEMGG